MSKRAAPKLAAKKPAARKPAAKKPAARKPAAKKPAAKMGAAPATIDAYMKTLAAEQRRVLERLRKAILAVVPKAEECISYAIPAFRDGGKVFAGFLATKHGYSYFPFSGTTLATLAADLTGYEQTKSSLHFDARGLPSALLRQLIAARRAEIAAAKR